MDDNKRMWRHGAFALGFFSTGIPYWLIPYGQISLPGTLMGPGLAGIVLAAMLLRAFSVTSFWKAVRLLTWAPAAAVMARVIVEGVLDPTSHNLWPFEVVFALAVGFACSLAGAFLGTIVMWLRGTRYQG
jgi:hypothetical protein